MRRRALRATYQKHRTTVRRRPAERHPCPLELKQIFMTDQAWATDITYSRLHKGFIYLMAITDLYSRDVLSWRLSNSQARRSV